MDQAFWVKRLQREQAARQQAEQALESIGQRLWQSNRDLEQAKNELEDEVERRTKELSLAITRLEQEVAARKTAEHELRESRDEALETSQLKVDFLGRMSHEIRTPLNAIIGFTGLLLDSELKNPQREQLKTVRSSGDLLLRIINDILDFSKIEAGKVDLEYQVCDLEKLFDDAVSLVQIQAREKGLSLIAPKLNDGYQKLFLDPARIQQVLLNLLTNALKCTDTGGITISANCQEVVEVEVPQAARTLGSRRYNRWARLDIAVVDSGIGIPQRHLDRLFDAFVQINPGSTGAGTGLGLSICKRLCQLMGGDIAVTSMVNQGSDFHFYVFGQIADDAESSSPSRRLDVSSPARYLSADHELPPKDLGIGKPLKILLADDYHVNRLIQQAQLEALGYQADLVCDGQEVLRAFRNQLYDVVLMDVRMPVMDGIEATRRLRNNKDIVQPYIIAITASALAQDQSTYLEAGIDGYVSKPVDIQELASALEQAYAQRHAEDSTEQLANESSAEAHEDVRLVHDELFYNLGPAANQLLARVIPVFIRELPARKQALRLAQQQGDAIGTAQILHGIKGASRSIGAVDLADLCERYEDSAEQGEVPNDQQLLELLTLCDQTLKTLTRKLPEYTSTD